ncbi:phosphatase 2C-like domain-containing protein [Vararia minispora EC-137]|uniref:Phosphatase 2C-like domain-containing protein n=1 Tax=Vararia minispora EC-137 TaxID=1314806 RepID=A0ACB8QGL5_9AGAM|nr:phosphatase 2C-like domain-containing protein [Vararia minispora EC-137]
MPPAPLTHAARALRRRTKLPRSRASSSTPMLRPYKFHVGASWLAKPADSAVRKSASPFPSDTVIGRWRDKTLSSGSHASSSTGAGEDFFYIQDMRNQSGLSLGIADGVGGWVTNGVDPSRFSQALMYHGHRYAALGWPGEPEIDPTQDYEERESVEGWELLPHECMDMAHQGVLREKSVVAGSSTACILNLNAASGTLRAANLGDSGFLIIRSSQVLHRQKQQTHFFNCPKQLAKLPTFMGQHTSSMTDYASAADHYETKLRDGDLIILYSDKQVARQTDGLTDNVFNSEITAICSLVARAGGSEDQQVQTMADRMVEYARSCMNNLERVSPFEKAATREGQAWFGGKMDEYVAHLLYLFKR